MPKRGFTIEDLLLLISFAATLILLTFSIVGKFWSGRLPASLDHATPAQGRRAAQRAGLVIGAVYFMLGGFWILFSDQRVSELWQDWRLVSLAQTLKGMVFITLSACLLGWLVARHYRQMFSAEAELRVSEERFRQVFEYSATGMAVLGIDGKFITVNRAICRMLGYEEGELVGRHFLEITAPSDKEICRHEIALMLAGTSDPMRLEKNYMRKDGSVFRGMVVGTVVRDARGKPLFMVGQVQDVSEQWRTEEALRKSEQKFRLLVEQSLVGVYIVQDSRFIYANPRAAEITGYSPEELLAMPSVLGIVMPQDHALVTEQYRRRMAGEISVAHYVFHGRHKSGSLVYIEVFGVVTEFNGKPAVLGTALDITEQKRVEEALHAVSGRLLKLQDDERRRIARDLHDTTAQELAALMMNLAVLQRNTNLTPEKIQQTLADSQALAERLTTEIRTLSYLLHPPGLELAGLPGAIREYARGVASRSGMEVIVESAPDLDRLPEDMEIALFRVVQESLGNILRHARSATAKITLERIGSTLTLQIQDQGRGIPAKRLATIKSLRGAFGVGIAGMSERLHQLKGTLEIQSGPGGTTVRATVPLPETNK